MIVTPRRLLWGYVLPMAVFVIALIFFWFNLSDRAQQIEELRRDRALVERRIDRQSCQRQKVNARVNRAQNRRLERLLDAALVVREQGGNANGFALAVAGAKTAMELENASLQPAAEANCERVMSSVRPMR